LHIVFLCIAFLHNEQAILPSTRFRLVMWCNESG
jgi:hypothetical protein